jgi:hypothetical protein
VITGISQWKWYLVQIADGSSEWFPPFTLLLIDTKPKLQDYHYFQEKINVIVTPNRNEIASIKFNLN